MLKFVDNLADHCAFTNLTKISHLPGGSAGIQYNISKEQHWNSRFKLKVTTTKTRKIKNFLERKEEKRNIIAKAYRKHAHIATNIYRHPELHWTLIL